jgi:hypothetical protein
MYTPVKAIKRQSEQGKQLQKPYNNLFSTAVSKIRQSIEEPTLKIDLQLVIAVFLP